MLNLFEYNNPVDVIVPMTRQEAMLWEVEISKSVNSLRILLENGYERQVWKALGHSTWTECLQALAEKYGFSERHAWRLHQANQTEILLTNWSVGEIPEGQLRPLTILPPEQKREAWQQAVETAPNGQLTAAHVQSVVDEIRGNGHKPKVIHVSDDSYEWYTPEEYIEAVREVLGWINLDPASCEEANTIVKAETFFTKKDDGLSQDWFGRVFLNPPYNMPLVEQFTARAIREYENGDVEEAIVLVNNATDTGWFQTLLDSYPACFTRGRVKFWTSEGPNLGARQGQVFFYLGHNPARFAEVFSQFGIVVQKYDHQ